MRYIWLYCILFLFGCSSVKGPVSTDNTNSDSSVAQKVGSGNDEIRRLQTGMDIGNLFTNAARIAITSIPYEDERRYGENVGLAMYATPGFGEPIMDEELGLFVNLLSNVIGQESERPEIKYHTAVIDSPKKNVYAAPGGFIFVTSGLILGLDSEAELAFALAHGIAAIASKQALNAIKSSKSFEALMKVSKELRYEHDVKDEDFYVVIEEHKQKILQPSVESQIDLDLRAVQYLVDVGYDPRVAKNVIAKIDTTDANKKTRLEILNSFYLEQQGEMYNLVTNTGRLPHIKNIIENKIQKD
ncbi:M48 family metalloprotease [Candidatus Uabimicrobium sp. HlEnr_7]|uniref:M48 family metalloprotease n=1 Tax=Candidatus Uabimicrobium helgolandensis TaxID=3095367 RepID=UPI0035565E7D